MPLERVENQQYIHYRKGALVMYLLQERLGEEAVDRALSRFLAKLRFKGAPYPRSVDLIAEFRKEAKTPEQQQLITDLFEQITLYDLKVSDATTRKDATGWTTTLTGRCRQILCQRQGRWRRRPGSPSRSRSACSPRGPGLGAFSAKDVMVMERQPIHSGTQQITCTAGRSHVRRRRSL